MRDLLDRDRVIAGVEKLRFFPLAVESGAGVELVEVGGRRLLDLSASWTASGLGHGHPAIADALARVARGPAGASILSATHPDAVGLAEDLLAVVPNPTGRDRRVYFGHSGSDANEVAIRACRQATGRPRVVAFEASYHGGLGTAMAASGVHVSGGSVAPDPSVEFVPYPRPFRDGPERYGEVLAALDAALMARDVACVLIEPILSDGGLVVPPDGFLADVQARCRATDTLLIVDEVKVGLGRPGAWHAFQYDGIDPDLVTFGKALGGGLPLSAVVGPAEVLDEPTASALLTTAGNPFSTAVGRAVLATMEAEDLVSRARLRGERLVGGLREVAAEESRIGDVRGRGLAIGVELVDAHGLPDSDLAARVVYRAWQLGAVLYYVGGNVLEVTPPLVIGEQDVDRAIDLIARAIGEADRVDASALAEFAGW